MQLKKGHIIEVDVTKYAFEGKGIAKVNSERLLAGEKDIQGEGLNNFVIFVNGSYPGDRVTAQLTKVKKSFAEAKVVEVIKSSEQRVKNNCFYFGTCGGCKQQDLDYTWQLKYKEEQVRDIFERIGGIIGFEMLPIEASEREFFYRNKMEFSFSDQKWLTIEEIRSEEKIEKSFALGLHIPGLYDKVLDIDRCYLQSEESNRILNFTRDFFKGRGTSIYTIKTHSGYLRNLVVKSSYTTKELMVNLVTSLEDDELMRTYTAGLLNAVPEISTVVNNISTKKAMIAFGDYEKVYYGPGYITDHIGGYKFRISANSFFQTNTPQAEKLYQTALEFSEVTGSDIVYDLYSGAGTISIFFTGHCKEVHAFETVEPAITDANENKRLNSVSNVSFYQSDLNNSILGTVESNNIPRPDVVILDPPRGGIHSVIVDDIAKLQPRRVVYISCNPATQARDIKLLAKKGYELIKIKPVDMFPHTYHIENVALLEIKPI